MDWMHLGEIVVLALTGGYAALQRSKKKMAKEAAKDAVDAAWEVLQREIDDTLDTFKKHLKPEAAGMVLLSELELKRERALAKGRAEAIRKYEEKMGK